MIDYATALAIVGGSAGWAKFLVWLNYVVIVLFLLSAMGAFGRYQSRK
jgi:hypothetical protein